MRKTKDEEKECEFRRKERWRATKVSTTEMTHTSDWDADYETAGSGIDEVPLGKVCFS